MKEKLREFHRVVSTEITVRLGECDPYGIANNANYFVWFEMGRFDYAKASGYKLTSMAADEDVIYITLHTKCKYIKSAHFEDELIVKTKINKIPVMYAKYSFEQELVDKKTGTLLAKCNTENAAVDRAKMSVLRIDDDRALMKLRNRGDEK